MSRALLVSFFLIGELVAVGVRGTMALDVSQLTNNQNAAFAGTLTLVTTTGTTTCQSAGGAVGTPASNHNTSCGSITLTAGPLYPGQSATATIRIENNGSLKAGELSVYVPNCTPTTGPSLCTALELEIQQSTPTACYFPSKTTSCSFDSYSSPGGAGTLSAFRTRYKVTTRLILTGGLDALSSRTITVGFALPSFSNPTSGNTYQGLSAKVTLTWYLTVTSTVT
ncbi:MAG: hypothetical protein ACRDWE_02000 [Acidimicrobiales bacterium]